MKYNIIDLVTAKKLGPEYYHIDNNKYYIMYYESVITSISDENIIEIVDILNSNLPKNYNAEELRIALTRTIYNKDTFNKRQIKSIFNQLFLRFNRLEGEFEINPVPNIFEKLLIKLRLLSLSNNRWDLA